MPRLDKHIYIYLERNVIAYTFGKCRGRANVVDNTQPRSHFFILCKLSGDKFLTSMKCEESIIEPVGHELVKPILVNTPGQRITTAIANLGFRASEIS